MIAGARGRIRLAPSPADARWDPSTLPTEEADEEPRWTELQLASRDGDIQRINELLSRHKDNRMKLEIVNEPAIGYYGQTALQAACMKGHETVARALLEAGANVNAPGGNNIYRTAFELACGTGQIGLIRLLLDAGAVFDPKKVTRYQGRTPIQAAAEGGHEAAVLLLLERGANINAAASPSSGVTALQTACFEGHVSLVKLLIARGADVNGLPGKFSGYTALQGACLAGEVDIVRILLGEGVDVNAPGSLYSGGTALHAAASRGNMEIVKILLSAGADPNSAAGRRGQTPMQSAYLIGEMDIVHLLLEAGATGPLTGGKILFGNGRTRSWTESEVKIIR
ncbi:ankyrin repeat protein [Truncatella angustata]|uniref:Ankyrin repeat protein n=1 Tax=Truncatella angustata TaxID=152316 RepID=A0A9P8UE91_9PEZI|nr:ankyrin repeat protein [Truncatella angustata]KAH6648343.1 ankyrin repeat protein [Truncatella angustata]